MEMMGRDVPAWEDLRADKALRREWRGLFGAHVSRFLITMYVGGVLGEWGVACDLTNDKLNTLQSFYSRFEGSISEAKKKAGVEHPYHLADAVRVLLSGQVIDWDQFDPDHPERDPAVAALRRGASGEAPAA
jgi:hypothetical protein